MAADLADRPQRGSVLLLFPAAVLVVIVLAAVAVDLSLAYQSKRRLERIVTAAADDGAKALDLDALRRGRPPQVDVARGRRIVLDELALAQLPGPLVGPVQVRPGPDPASLEVTASVRAPSVLRSAVPFAGEPDTVTVRVVGRLVETER